MITHEIQPNLRLFELSQITSSVFFSSRAPWQPSATLISKDLEKSWGLPLFLKSPAFKSACLNMAQSKVPEVWLWTTAPSQYRRGTGRNRQKQRGKWREFLRLIKTYTLSVLCREFTQNPYISLNFHSLLTLFKSLSREDVQSKALSLGREAEHSRVEPREEGEGESCSE